ncbi:hypothetical protein [Epilithonimonas arachidiradicis]|uniref:Uncharacterized protein n=1 Tax=Epilithonimonas arachidiradicis TaxID=1617282 RepID=A0A420D8X9_9FLAO|nr:hypothetical protein [Epilithonimonas arachidiradicis]RKE87260.1 hypothetical protein BXY58_2140 [Epilithonimonas arachidiradicis]GGG59537.1 hypothetical protein GCM10007332_21530 [Epilithonimonas arachidiradicis]
MKRKPHFKALLNYYSSEEGGLVTPVSPGYRTGIRFPFDSQEFIGIQIFPDGQLIFSGDIANVDMQLVNADQIIERLYEGIDFEMVINSNVIGTGVIVTMY